MKVFHIEFQPNLKNSVWDAWKSPFTDFYKLGFIVDQYG
jgi:hypothetical protein